MRSVALGYGHYLFWHVPTLLIAAASLCALLAVARQLALGAYGPSARALRWSIVGWCSLALSIASAIVVPYLKAAAVVSVQADGAWEFHNYLRVPLGRIEAHELRELRARDLGGVGAGVGSLEVRRADGSVLRTVRIDRARLQRALDVLGYRRDELSPDYGDVVLRAHRYDDRSRPLAALAR